MSRREAAPLRQHRLVNRLLSLGEGEDSFLSGGHGGHEGLGYDHVPVSGGDVGDEIPVGGIESLPFGSIAGDSTQH